MGRELKRVPVDFKWPINQLWKGYVNPYDFQECKSCEGSGLNIETKKLSDSWYGFNNENNYKPNPYRDGWRYNDNAWQYHLTQLEVDALVKSNRLRDLTHTFIQGTGWVEKEPKHHPTPEEVKEWSLRTMGHDSINRWVCVQARAKHLGVYGHCEYCDDGRIWSTDEIKKLHEEWVSFDPPVGEGYQLWSTTSEGHPMTPVFETLELLCQYCEENDVSIFAKDTMTKEEWFKMLDDSDEICDKPIIYKTSEGMTII